MRPRSYLCFLSIALLIVPDLCFAQQDKPPAQPLAGSDTWSLNILFTGRLMGYFRIPTWQSGQNVNANLPCPAPPTLNASQQASNLLRTTEPYRYQSRLLLGTGDNFALHLPSRVLEPPPFSPGQNAKDQFDWDSDPSHPGWVVPRSSKEVDDRLSQGGVIIPTDNVGCFLAKAGYDAIVPGKEDFYFGADRVRALARFLASIPAEGADYHPVQMLAANLLIKTAWHSDHDPLPDSKKPRLQFDISDVSQTPHVVFPPEGAEILPWLAEIEVAFGEHDNPDTSELVISGPLPDPDREDWKINTSGAQWSIQFQTGDPNYHCWAAPNTDPSYAVSTCGGLHPPTLQSTSANRRWRLSPISPLSPGNYRACIWPPHPVLQSRPTCSRFHVGFPLLQYSDAPEPSQNPPPYIIKSVCPHSTQTPCPGDQVPVAVLGVVDPDFESKVGKLNSAWVPLVKGEPQEKYDTSLEVLDPATALKQLVIYLVSCSDRTQESESDKCYGANPSLKIKSKILLAQMESGQASLLATRLTGVNHFDVVITAYDEQQFTRNQISVVDPTFQPGRVVEPLFDCDKVFCKVPPFVAVPPPAWDRSWVGDQDYPGDPVRVLRISQNALHQREYVVSGARQQAAFDYSGLQTAETSLHNWGRQVALANPQSPADAHQYFITELRQILPDDVTEKCNQPVPPPSQCQLPADPPWPARLKLLEKATLYAMLNETHADIAIAQKKDFFLDIDLVDCLLRQLADSSHPCYEFNADHFSPGHSWRLILDAVLWKGDILTVMPVRGSVLQAVMKQSHQFDANDDSSLSLPRERNRGLVTLGIKSDGFKDSYLINDVPLDPNRLYSVAATDYFALGDTGYPQLIDPSVPDFPRVLYSQRPLKYVSALVCSRLLKSLGMDVRECAPEFKADEYFDELTVRPPTPPPGNTWQEGWKQWFEFWQRRGQNPPSKKVDSLETFADEHPPTWKFSLDKTSIGFGIQRHSDTQKFLNDTFGGVSNSQATAPTSHNWATDQEMSFTLNGYLADFVASEALLYTAAFTDAKSGLYRNPNQSVDSLTLSIGPRFHFAPQKRKLSHWALGTYLHYDTQPFRLEQSLSLTTDMGFPVALPNQFYLPRVHTVTGRLGIGRYYPKSYFEIGVEGGQAIGAFDQFDFYTGGVLVLRCVPSATLSLQKCVSTMGDTIVTPNSKVTTLQSTRSRTGLYWHNLLVFPTGPKMTTTLENQGEFYFNNSGDNSTDTRIQHLTTAKYLFQVWPSLSFAPTYQIFLYENKQAYKSLWQQQAMLTINFNFSLTSDRIKGSQIEYQPPPPK